MGKTPEQNQIKLAKILGVPKLIFKREDLGKFGSHKGRSIPKMIKDYSKKGINDFVISSSGNAALAAIESIGKANLKIYVGKNINKEKLKILKNKIGDKKNIKLFQVKRPKQSAFIATRGSTSGKPEVEPRVAVFLRQSTDDSALLGYSTLAQELKKIKNLEAIFIPTSSGTTAQALAENLKNVQIHITQTTACHPIASVFDKKFKSTKKSIAGAIVDIIAHRKEKLTKLIKKSKGFGWVLDDKKIKQAIELVKKESKINISPNSALSVAGLQKAVDNGWRFKGTVVCLITGK